MRTIQEIKKQMTDGILRDQTMRDGLNLDADKPWDEQVSSVSIINILLYIVAVAHYTLERIFETFKEEVEDRIAAAYPGSISWLWNRAMEFQDDDEANAYFHEHGTYQNMDSEKRIIKHVAVVEEYNTVQIKVSGKDYQPLTDVQKTSFEAYMNALKFAGVKLSISSLRSDDLALKIHIWRNRLLMPEENDETLSSVISGYLNNIRYGGIFNKTKLMDAVQTIQGVEDVTIEGCVFTAHDSNGTVTDLSVQNYSPIAGHINLKELEVVYE